MLFSLVHSKPYVLNFLLVLQQSLSASSSSAILISFSYTDSGLDPKTLTCYIGETNVASNMKDLYGIIYEYKLLLTLLDHQSANQDYTYQLENHIPQDYSYKVLYAILLDHRK